ncbi:MAG TPA: bifunctional oligoribonuclease/PAP phosphatase NrnA [Candidatus Sulfomarinibacteraceae bacterium]|nr:bifunctional oligoribonuclease/PAP phosphatase NrnA [Candidatus Sulfomarinibacteraceae bacterium]
MSDNVQAIKQLLEETRHILAITHISPDGDAIGSLTAMGLAARQLGKRVTMVCDDGSPSRFNYLPLVDRIQKRYDVNEAYDLIIALDCGDMARMGQAFAQLPEPHPPIVNIDHHVTNTRFGDVNVVNSECNSTTEILYGLLPKLGVRLDDEVATSLLTGIVTDTLGFRTVGVNAATFSAASALMEAGANLGMITAQALLLKPHSTLRLWQIGLDNMKLEAEGFLWTSISRKELRAINHVGTSSGGLVNMLANVSEAAMSAVLLEDEDKVHVGFRCRPPFNVAELALNLGGGGHPLAAGCTLEGSLQEAESLVVSMGREAIRQQRELLKAEH